VLTYDWAKNGGRSITLQFPFSPRSASFDPKLKNQRPRELPPPFEREATAIDPIHLNNHATPLLAISGSSHC